MTARLRYGMRGHPAGAVVEVLTASDPRVQAAWAGIPGRHESDQSALTLPGRDTPTIALVRELAVRGIRRRGTVKDALPYTTPHGGAVFQPEGAQMVLRIELDPETGTRRTVTCQLVEDSDAAKRRIGTPIEVLEHPENPNIRAIAGYLPNGRKAS